MTDLPQRLPEAAGEAWQSYRNLRTAKHRHRIELSNPIADKEGIQKSLEHHEHCIAEFRKATKKLQQDNQEAHAAFLQCLAEEPDA